MMKIGLLERYQRENTELEVGQLSSSWQGRWCWPTRMLYIIQLRHNVLLTLEQLCLGCRTFTFTVGAPQALLS